MKKAYFIFLLITISLENSYSQEFKENSIGVVSVRLDLKTEYELVIVFPFETILNYEIKKPILEWKDVVTQFVSQSPITLFDDKGELATIKVSDSIKIEFWCENDGGIQFRPTFTTRIKKQNLKRGLKANFQADNISCFVIVNMNRDNIEPVLEQIPSDKIKLKGDLDGNGTLDALVWAEADDSGNCDLSFHLASGVNDHYLNCCGP